MNYDKLKPTAYDNVWLKTNLNLQPVENYEARFVISYNSMKSNETYMTNNHAYSLEDSLPQLK